MRTIEDISFPVLELSEKENLFHSLKSLPITANKRGLRNIGQNGRRFIDSTGRVYDSVRMEKIGRADRSLWNILIYGVTYEIAFHLEHKETISLYTLKSLAVGFVDKNKESIEALEDPYVLIEKIQSADNCKDVIGLFF